MIERRLILAIRESKLVVRDGGPTSEELPTNEEERKEKEVHDGLRIRVAHLREETQQKINSLLRYTGIFI